MIRVGSIGLGGVSSCVHIPGIQASPDLQLTALCDNDPGRLAERAAQYGIPEDHCFTEYRDLIACKDVDAVDISTPNDVHYEIAMEAVRAGKPYGLEKPVTLHGAQADELAQATAEAGLASMVYFSYRYRAAARYAKALIEEGRIGNVLQVQMQYFQGWGLAQRNVPLVWRFEKARTGTGALGDLGCHALDLVTFVTGKKYTRVCAQLETVVKERKLLTRDAMGTVDVDDYSNILAAMEGGGGASFQITRLAYMRDNYQRMEVYGEKGALVYRLDRKPGCDELELCDETTGNRYTEIPVPQPYYVSQMQCFAEEMAGHGDGWNATIREGKYSQHLLDTIEKASVSGKWETVE